MLCPVFPIFVYIFHVFPFNFSSDLHALFFLLSLPLSLYCLRSFFFHSVFSFILYIHSFILSFFFFSFSCPLLFSWFWFLFFLFSSLFIYFPNAFHFFYVCCCFFCFVLFCLCSFFCLSSLFSRSILIFTFLVLFFSFCVLSFSFFLFFPFFPFISVWDYHCYTNCFFYLYLIIFSWFSVECACL